MRKTLTLAAAVVTALFAGATTPVTVQAQSASVSLSVCNNTRTTAQVAISYQPIRSRTFYTEGWFNIRPGRCETLLTTNNSYMYAYAEVEGSDTLVWQGDHPLCVEYPGPFEFWDTGSDYCESHQDLRNFQVLHATQPGVFTWNLDG